MTINLSFLLGIYIYIYVINGAKLSHIWGGIAAEVVMHIDTVVVPRDPCVCNMHDVHSGIPRFFLGVLPVIVLARIIGDTETGEHTL